MKPIKNSSAPNLCTVGQATIYPLDPTVFDIGE